MIKYLSKKICSNFIILSILIICSFYSCNKRCPDYYDNIDLRIYFRITDLLSGVDISSTGEVESLDVFFFDQNMTFQKHLQLSSDEIRMNTPITVINMNVNGWWVSVWGNLKDGQIRPVPLKDNVIDGLYIRLKESQEAGFYDCPDDLFFGISRIDQSSQQSSVSRMEIPVTRKNGRMNITVRGLANDITEDDYYFTVKGNHNGYNLMGVPVAGPVEIKQTGRIEDTDLSFVTPEAFNVIHTMDNLFMTINLYQVSPTRAASLIASVTEDGRGNPILPLAGQTTNILMDMLPNGELEVHVEVTPWDEKYVWNRW